MPTTRRIRTIKHDEAVPQSGSYEVRYAFPDGCSSPSSFARPIRFVRKRCLRDKIVEYSDRVFDPMATAAVDGRFEAVIDLLQPKQWCAINIGLRIPKHADLAAADRGQQNRRFWTIPRNARESAVGSCHF